MGALALRAHFFIMSWILKEGEKMKSRDYEAPELILIFLGEMDILTASGNGEGEIPEDPGTNDGEWTQLEW